jgi:addiction module HigA family antidote
MTEYIDLDHTGKILQEECMEFDKLSHNAFAKAIGVVPSRITNIVNGCRAITIDTDLRLIHLLDSPKAIFCAYRRYRNYPC